MSYYAIIVKKWHFQHLDWLKWHILSSICSGTLIILKIYQQVRFLKKSKLAEFGEDTISVDEVMTSQIIQRTAEFDDVLSLSFMSQLLRNFSDFLTLMNWSSALMFAYFHSVDGYLQKYCYLQTSYTYVIELSL